MSTIWTFENEFTNNEVSLDLDDLDRRFEQDLARYSKKHAKYDIHLNFDDLVQSYKLDGSSADALGKATAKAVENDDFFSEEILAKTKTIKLEETDDEHAEYVAYDEKGRVLGRAKAPSFRDTLKERLKEGGIKDTDVGGFESLNINPEDFRKQLFDTPGSAIKTDLEHGKIFSSDEWSKTKVIKARKPTDSTEPGKFEFVAFDENNLVVGREYYIVPAIRSSGFEFEKHPVSDSKPKWIIRNLDTNKETTLDLSNLPQDLGKDYFDEISKTFKLALERREIFSPEVVNKAQIIKATQLDDGAESEKVEFTAFDANEASLGSQYYIIGSPGQHLTTQDKLEPIWKLGGEHHGETFLDLSNVAQDFGNAGKGVFDGVGKSVKVALEQGEIFSSEILNQAKTIKVDKPKGAKEEGELEITAYNSKDVKVGHEYYVVPTNQFRKGASKVLGSLGQKLGFGK